MMRDERIVELDWLIQRYEAGETSAIDIGDGWSYQIRPSLPGISHAWHGVLFYKDRIVDVYSNRNETRVEERVNEMIDRAMAGGYNVRN